MFSTVQENEDEPNERRPYMARHRYQDGCVFQRGIRRRVWVGRWREAKIGPGVGNKSILRSVVLGLVTEIPTKREARKLLQRRLEQNGEQGSRIEIQMRLSDYVEKCWQPAILPTYRRSTQVQCRLALENHLFPAFGQRRLCDLTRFEIQSFFGKLAKKLAPDTIHGIHRFLRKILADAVEWKYISENPAKGIRLPPSRRREPPFIEPLHFQELLAAVAEPARTMVLLAMMTSMRIEEILGLRWGRVDLENGVLRVVETYYRGQFSAVKSRRSERRIPLSPIIHTALRQRRGLVNGGPADLVFATRSGKALSDGNLLKRLDLSSVRPTRYPASRLARAASSSQYAAFSVGRSRGGSTGSARARRSEDHTFNLYPRDSRRPAAGCRTIGAAFVPKLFPSCDWSLHLGAI